MWERSREAGTFRLFLISKPRERKVHFLLFCNRAVLAAQQSSSQFKDLCCAKMLLITRESINFTVNEVIIAISVDSEVAAGSCSHVNDDAVG